MVYPIPTFGHTARVFSLWLLSPLICFWEAVTEDVSLFPSLGPVTNAFIVLAPASMFNPDCKPTLPLPKFSKNLLGTESSEGSGNEAVMLRLGVHRQVPMSGRAGAREGSCPDWGLGLEGQPPGES